MSKYCSNSPMCEEDVCRCEEYAEYEKTHSNCCDAIIVNGRCNNCKENV